MLISLSELRLQDIMITILSCHILMTIGGQHDQRGQADELAATATLLADIFRVGR